MYKYKKALDILYEETDYKDYSNQTVNRVNEAFISIAELVDKATPKKPIRFKNSIYISNPKCPICQTIPHTGNQKYCDECGQKLDWSDENV